jgi:hypothetical protein
MTKPVVAGVFAVLVGTAATAQPPEGARLLAALPADSTTVANSAECLRPGRPEDRTRRRSFGRQEAVVSVAMVSVGSFRTLTQAPGKALGQAVTLECLNDKIDEGTRL